ncbi:MAG: SUMF1/EgtB/PvdO family nonheme iron enzyme [Rhodobacteraceae bacterium]|nr:SUMF1/EgtB/PvdO family nonheme iron enzyme [Paracoccaceae bacterium]MCP5341744.1 SUMF1/EgtB/PvdO family nonheme iron enzyme [Paracoccaceae bacterium]
MRRVLLAAMFAFAPGATPAATEITWPIDQYDPGSETKPADLVLPMPCGGAMAFQKVSVPIDASNPLDDRRLRVGQSQKETGYSDYLRTDYLRGAFTDPAGGDSFYYIARYEMTQAQARALKGDCAPPKRGERTAEGGMTWFDAVELSRVYSEWLLGTARDALPETVGGAAWLRLPTETEWEYAARGGAVIDPLDFTQRRFFGEANIDDYVKHAGNSRGKLSAVGLRLANPLGLYDIYGNAEELMLEPYRLNAIGRTHGQVGGIVTRGGSVLSSVDEIYSARRVEYPLFKIADGTALRGDMFGLRLVLSRNVATTDGVVSDIHDRWIALAEASSGDTAADPLATLSSLIDEETDPRKQASLSELQLDFRRARQDASTAFSEAAKSTLLSGAVLIGALRDGVATLRNRRDDVRAVVDEIGVTSDAGKRANLKRTAEQIVQEMNALRQLQRTYLLSYSSALSTLSNDIEPTIAEKSFRLLVDELMLADQDQILAALQLFWGDLEAYRARPDMTETDLLTLALTR